MTITPFQMDVHINSYQVDSRYQLTLSSLFQLFQEAAYRHAEAMGWGRDFLVEQNRFWALTRVTMEIDRMPQWNEDLIIKTAPRMAEGVMAPRDLLLIDEKGDVCIRCTSYWIIMDSINRTPVIPRNFFDNFIFSDECNLCQLPFKKIRGEFEEKPLYEREVYHSSLDMNNHVNNSIYINFLADGLPQGLDDLDLKTFQIAFQREAKVGDQLTIYKGGGSDGSLLLKALSAEGSDLVTARMTLR